MRSHDANSLHLRGLQESLQGARPFGRKESVVPFLQACRFGPPGGTRFLAIHDRGTCRTQGPNRIRNPKSPGERIWKASSGTKAIGPTRPCGHRPA